MWALYIKYKSNQSFINKYTKYSLNTFHTIRLLYHSDYLHFSLHFTDKTPTFEPTTYLALYTLPKDFKWYTVFQNIPKHSWVFWNDPQRSGMFRFVSEHSATFQNVPGCSGTLWNALEYLRMSSTVLEIPREPLPSGKNGNLLHGLPHYDITPLIVPFLSVI